MKKSNKLLVLAMQVQIYYLLSAASASAEGLTPAKQEDGLFLFCLYLIGYAICSGANVAYFSFPLRKLKRKAGSVENPTANEGALTARRAETILAHLEDPNWTLAAILLANVVFGVQVSQLSENLFTGLLAVVMPVVCITVFGEFFSQATFLRFAVHFCSAFSPLIWLLKWLTAPVSWPLARAVDALYGRQALGRLNERDLISDLELELTEFGEKGSAAPCEERLDPRELKILMNVARSDDEHARIVGEALDPVTEIALPFKDGKPVFPKDYVEFVRTSISKAAHPWYVVVDEDNHQPQFLLDADGFVRALFRELHCEMPGFQPEDHIYRARIYTDSDIKLGPIVSDLQVYEEQRSSDIIDVDVSIIWTAEGRWIVTGGDILGRFLRGVAKKKHWRQNRVSHLCKTTKID